MAKHGPVLGIDFGTSNSAAGYFRDGSPHLVTFPTGEATMPTTFFFDFETRKTLIGAPANQALLNGEDGRFMRALKRVLGTSLMHEKRQILNESVTFVDIIARFLRQIKACAEADAGVTFDRVLSGRPVVFHGAHDPREDQAEADLKQCYLAAGFSDVRFLPEPEAAALASGANDAKSELGLIVDIGGGTSDFSVFRTAVDGIEILANHGVRIGGTDFDRAISIDQVMPMFGKGTDLRKVIGAGLSPVPNAMFHDLATWERIPFLYTGQNRRQVAEMERLAQEPEKLARLASVLEDELGHDVAFAVERGKIAANAQGAIGHIDLGLVEKGLSWDVTHDTMTACLATYAQELREGAIETVACAGVDVTDIDRVVYVGGSSMMSVVSEAMTSEFPKASHSFRDVFTAVTSGLAIAAGRL
ncbi:Hsp70 family protein [Shimia litoralis]|uniref:Hsp70 family protein n=1 Tax=Shimia litoralis TaxID=420403 RepID=A0A4U7N5Q4_9RHOB|nr:Hsp70 family protein [Shimia litoralis]TKZ21175.1 Hsp70 family protein [Shimia litoralis]